MCTSGGGVEISYSIHAGLGLVLDRTRESDLRAERVLTVDPGIDIVRHADAGYETSIRIIKEKKIKAPMIK